MPICMIIENPEQTREQAERGIAHVRTSGPTPPDGARVLFGGPMDPGWRFVSVWDTREDLERFVAERLGPAYAEIGLSLDGVTRTLFPVHTLVAGDLTGTPQPA